MPALLSALDEQSARENDIARVRILYRFMPRSVLITVAVALICVVVLWEQVPHASLLAWATAMATISAGRMLLYRAFRRADDADARSRRWENLAAIGATSIGLAWAWLALIGSLPPVYEVFVVFILGGMALGSAGVLGTSVRAFAGFTAPVMTAQIGELIYMGGDLYNVMALMGILFAVGLIVAFAEFRRALQTSIASHHEVRRLHALQRLIFETATAGMSYNRDRCILDCNPQFARMLGYTREELTGTSMRNYYVEESVWEEIGVHGYEALRRGEPYRREVRFRTKTGGIITCDATMQSLVAREPDRGVVVILNDISLAKERENALRQALLQQMAIFNNAPVGILFQRRRVIEDCNEHMARMIGIPREQLIGTTTQGWFDSPATWETHGAAIYAAFARGESYSYEDEFVRPDGSRFWCRVRGGAMDPADPINGPAVFVLIDTTDRKQAEDALKQSREQMVLVIRATQSGIWDMNLADGEIVFSARFYEILGFPVTSQPSAVMPVVERVHPDEIDRMKRAFRAHIVQRKPINEVFRLRRADDSYVWVRGHGQASWNEHGRATRFVGSITDISEIKRQEDDIRRMALEDPLTGLPNRRLLEDRLERAIALAARHHSQVALMLLDLDGFKAVNDVHGHVVGDMVLRAVAKRLQRCVREADSVARVGGDEFVVLTEQLQHPEDAGILADKLLGAMREPIAIDGQHFEVGVSIGIAIYPRDAIEATHLLRMADKAMYRVKESGRNQYRFAGAARNT